MPGAGLDTHVTSGRGCGGRRPGGAENGHVTAGRGGARARMAAGRLPLRSRGAPGWTTATVAAAGPAVVETRLFRKSRASSPQRARRREAGGSFPDSGARGGARPRRPGPNSRGPRVGGSCESRRDTSARGGAHEGRRLGRALLRVWRADKVGAGGRPCGTRRWAGDDPDAALEFLEEATPAPARGDLPPGDPATGQRESKLRKKYTVYYSLEMSHVLLKIKTLYLNISIASYQLGGSNRSTTKDKYFEKRLQKYIAQSPSLHL